MFQHRIQVKLMTGPGLMRGRPNPGIVIVQLHLERGECGFPATCKWYFEEKRYELT